MKRKKTACILGIEVGSGTLDDIINQSLELIDCKQCSSTFVCVNPHSIVEASKDPIFFNALNNADFSVADGVGVALAANILRLDAGPRIAGYDYFLALMSALNDRGGRVFFFGSTQRALDLIEKRFTKEYPNINLCGMLSPPFGEWSDKINNEMIEIINKSQPDVLWVGMTAPKQEKWAEINRHNLNVAIIGSIGAVFDFYAGTYPRAPKWMCRFGVEWLYRLLKEPRRMWRRNFVSNPLFVWRVLTQHVLRKN